MMLIPLHQPDDQAKLREIAASLSKEGWVGRPVIALDCGDHLRALTGSHRIAAAEMVGVEVPVVVIEQPPFEGDYELADLFGDLAEGDDYDRLEAIETLVELGLVDTGVIEIFREE